MRKKKEEPVEPEPASFDLEENAFSQGEDRGEFEKVFEQMLKPENIHHVTDLTQDEITAFSILGTIADKYQLTVLQDFLRENLKLRVSKNRKGRSEVVRIATRQQTTPQPRRFFDFRGQQ